MVPASRKRSPGETFEGPQKSKPKMSLETYEKKQGLGQHLGGEYQYLMCAFYALKCASNHEVEDFKLATTNNKYQVFDDVTFEVTWRNGDHKIFVFQLKHGEPQRNLTTADFQREHLKNKKYLKNPFCLQKHAEAIESTSEDNIVFVLFTNNTTSLDPSSKVNDKVAVSVAGYSQDLELLVNTERINRSDIFELTIRESSKTFYFITNQRNVFSVKHCIERKIRDLFGRHVHGFFDFMKDWWAGNFILTKTDVMAKLTELALSPFTRELSNEKSNEKSEVLARKIKEFDVTIVEKSRDDIVTKIWNISGDPDLGLALKFGLTTGKDAPLSELHRQLVQWYSDEVPMVVAVDDGNQNTVARVVKFWSNHKHRKKLVLLVTSEFPELKMNSLTKLSDLHSTKELKNFQVSYQGKDVTTLGSLLQQDEDLGDVIKVRELLEMTQGPFNIGTLQDNALIESAYAYKIVNENLILIPEKNPPKTTNILRHFNERVNIISGPVGIGKTYLLKQLNQSCLHSWSLYINLHQYSLAGKDNETILCEFLSSTKDFEHHFLKTNKVYLFLDELDLVEDVDRVLKFVCEVDTRVWIAARDQLKNKLAGVLGVVPIQLQLCSDHQLLRTPLSLAIAARNPNELFLEKTIFEGVSAFCLQKQYPGLHQDHLNCLQKQCLEDHQVLALKCCLQKTFDKLQLDLERASRVTTRVNNLGIVTKREKKLVFDQAFLHYFAALWLSEHLEFLPAVQEDYFAEESASLRRFFDSILVKDNPILLSIVKGEDWKASKECVDKGGRNALHLLCSSGSVYPKNSTYQRMKRESPSYVAQLEEVLRDFGLTARDRLFNFDYFSYALHSRSLYPVERLLGESRQPQDLKPLLDYYHPKSLLFYSCQMGYHRILDVILAKTPETLREDFGGFSLPQVTILGALNEDYKTPRFGNIAVLRTLHTNMRIQRHEMSNLLEFACQNTCYDMIEPLRSLCDRITNNNTVLHLAAKHDTLDEEIFTISLRLGVGIGDKNMDGQEAIHIACEENHLKSLRFLIAKGADVNARCNEGKTPLHYAVRSAELVRVLLREGADPNLRDVEDMTPLDAARRFACEESVEILGPFSCSDAKVYGSEQYKNIERMKETL